MGKDFVELSKKWFDHQAGVYDSRDQILYSRYGKISCKNIAAHLKGRSYRTLLDIGSGTGYLIDLLSKEHDAEYVGLDLSPNMIREAEKKQIRNARFVEGRSDALPFEDNSFDVVTCSQSFHHYPDTDRALQEALRVLRPGGIYLLSDTGAGPFGKAGALIDSFVYRHFSNTGDCSVSCLKKMAEDMKRNGFRILHREQVTLFIYTVIGQKTKKTRAERGQ